MEWQDQELDKSDSYIPYLTVFGFSDKSQLHIFVHILGALLGHGQLINAQMLDRSAQELL